MSIFEIPVYRAEVDLGLRDKILANASIAYCVQLEKWDEADPKVLAKWLENSPQFSKASVQDLYPTKSVLVTTNWNKNDDVFGRLPTWAARHTPVNKPTNLEHDEKQLVGHMTGTWAMDFDGKLIADDTAVDDLPHHFHLCNSAVIYKAWQDKALQERTTELIASIEQGEKFVSMECLFAGFDYAVVTDSGEHIIIPRDSTTAHLSQHLRAYGGEGSYDGCKIGRFLQNIIFTAKGYVNKPANSNSVIFASSDLFYFEEKPANLKTGVSLSSDRTAVAEHSIQREDLITMSENILQAQLDEVKQALANATGENKTLQDRLAKADVEKHESRIAELEGKLTAEMDDKEKKKKKADDAEAKAVELEAQVAALTEANTKLTEQVEAAEAAKVQASRVSLLVDGQIEKVKAEETVKQFSNLNDEQFSVIATTLIDAAKAQFGKDDKEDKDKDKDKDKKKTDKSKADEEVDDEGEASAEENNLENAEAEEEVEITSARENVDTNKTRTNLSKLIAKRLGTKTGE